MKAPFKLFFFSFDKCSKIFFIETSLFSLPFAKLIKKKKNQRLKIIIYNNQTQQNINNIQIYSVSTSFDKCRKKFIYRNWPTIVELIRKNSN